MKISTKAPLAALLVLLPQARLLRSRRSSCVASRRTATAGSRTSRSSPSRSGRWRRCARRRRSSASHGRSAPLRSRRWPGTGVGGLAVRRGRVPAMENFNGALGHIVDLANRRAEGGGVLAIAGRGRVGLVAIGALGFLALGHRKTDHADPAAPGPGRVRPRPPGLLHAARERGGDEARAARFAPREPESTAATTRRAPVTPAAPSHTPEVTTPRAGPSPATSPALPPGRPLRRRVRKARAGRLRSVPRASNRCDARHETPHAPPSHAHVRRTRGAVGRSCSRPAAAAGEPTLAESLHGSARGRLRLRSPPLQQRRLRRRDDQVQAGVRALEVTRASFTTWRSARRACGGTRRCGRSSSASSPSTRRRCPRTPSRPSTRRSRRSGTWWARYWSRRTSRARR